MLMGLDRTRYYTSYAEFSPTTNRESTRRLSHLLRKLSSSSLNKKDIEPEGCDSKELDELCNLVDPRQQPTAPHFTNGMQKDVRKYFMSEERDRREVNRLISVLAKVNLVYGFTAFIQHLYALTTPRGVSPRSSTPTTSFSATVLGFRF